MQSCKWWACDYGKSTRPALTTSHIQQINLSTKESCQSRHNVSHLSESSLKCLPKMFFSEMFWNIFGHVWDFVLGFLEMLREAFSKCLLACFDNVLGMFCECFGNVAKNICFLEMLWTCCENVLDIFGHVFLCSGSVAERFCKCVVHVSLMVLLMFLFF